MANRVVHFEIVADDPDRAIKFYENVFGWEIKKWDSPDAEMEYWMVMTGPKEEPGINGGLYRRMEEMPKGPGIGAYICTISVDDVDEYSKKIEDAGGKITMPKEEIKGVGWFAAAQDTEGNNISIMKMSEEMAAEM